MSYLCPIPGANPDADVLINLFGYKRYTKILNLLTGDNKILQLTESPEYKKLVKKFPDKEKQILKALGNHVLYLDREQRVNSFNEHVNKVVTDDSQQKQGQVAKLIRMINTCSAGYSAYQSERNSIFLKAKTNDTDYIIYKYDTEKKRFIPIFPDSWDEHKEGIQSKLIQVILSNNGLYCPTFEELKEDFGDRLDSDDLEEIKNAVANVYFLGNYLDNDKRLDIASGHFSGERLTSLENKMKNYNDDGKNFSEHFATLTSGTDSAITDYDIEFAKSVAILCGLKKEKDSKYDISQEDQYTMINYFAGFFAEAIHMFYLDPEMFTWTYLDDRLVELYEERISNLSKARDLKGLFQLISPRDLLDMAKYNLINISKYGTKSRDKQFGILAESKNGNEALVDALYTMSLPIIFRLTGIKLNSNAIKSKLNDSYNYIETSEEDQLFDDDSSYDDSSNESDDSYDEDDSNSNLFGEYLSAKSTLNYDVTKKARPTICRALSGIRNVTAKITSDYSAEQYYDPDEIYTHLIESCRSSKDSEDMMEKIKGLEYSWVDDVIERLSNKSNPGAINNLKTRLFAALRMQQHKYIGVYQFSNGHLVLSEVNRRRYTNMVQSIIDDIQQGTIPGNEADDLVHLKNGKFDQSNENSKVIVNNILILLNILKDNSLYSKLSNDNNLKSIKGKIEFDSKYSQVIITGSKNDTLSLHNAIQEYYTYFNQKLSELGLTDDQLNACIACGLTKESRVYQIFNAIVNTMNLKEFGVEPVQTAAAFREIAFPVRKYRGKTGKPETVYIDMFGDSKIYKIINALKEGDAKKFYTEFNSRFTDISGKAGYSSKFYAGKQTYYAITHTDLASRLDELCHNDKYEGEENEPAKNYFKERKANDLFTSSLLAFENLENGNSMDWMVRGLASPNNIPHLKTFSTQETQKFSQLNKISQLLGSITAMNGTIGARKDNVHPFFSGLILADKSRSYFYKDETIQQLYTMSDCLDFMARKVCGELFKIRQVRTIAIAYKSGDYSTKIPGCANEYLPALTADDKIDFTSAKSAQFGLLPFLNTYLYEINNVDKNGKYPDKTETKFSAEEKELIEAFANCVYSKADPGSQDFNNSYSKVINLLASDNDDRSRDKSFIKKFIHKNEVERIEKILFENYEELAPKLGLRFDGKSERGKEIADRMTAEHRKDFTFDEFIYNFKSDVFNSLTKNKSAHDMIVAYVYNYCVAAINQAVLLSGDLTIYKDSVDFSKRGGQFTASGTAYDLEARDHNGELYEDRREEYRGKKTSILFPDISVFSENCKYVTRKDKDGNPIYDKNDNPIMDYDNPLVSDKSVKLINDIFRYKKDKVLKQLRNKYPKMDVKDIYKLNEYKALMNEVDDQLHTILGPVCSTDGQSFVTIKALRRLKGQLGESTPALDDFLKGASRLIKKAAEIIKDFKEKNNDDIYGKKGIELRERLQNEVLQGEDGYIKLFETFKNDDSMAQLESEKQFTAGFVKHELPNSGSVCLLTQVKNSEVNTVSLDDLINNRSFFMIELISALQDEDIDGINLQSTMKNGQVTVCPIIENGEIKSSDDIIKIVKGILSGGFRESYIYKHNMEDVVKQTEVPSHWLDKRDTLGSQFIKILPSYIDFDENYTLPEFNSQHGNLAVLDGKQLYNEFQYLLAAKYQLSTAELYRYFNIEPGDPLFIKLQYGVELDSSEKMQMMRKISTLFSSEIQRSEFVSVQHILQYLINAQDKDHVDFFIPLSEGVNQVLLSKMISSLIKKNIIRQKVQGGQFVQATDCLKDAFIRALRGDKQYLSNELNFVHDKINGVDHYYFEAEMPEPYTDMLKSCGALDENNNVDMKKVPEYMKHAIMYRIPTEGMCSIFHIKVKRFVSGASGGTIKLPSILPSIAGIDFDIDKLFAFIANLRQEGDKYVYDTFHQKINDFSEYNGLTEYQIDNMLFERAIAMSNSMSHVSSLFNPGGYKPLSLSSDRKSLLLQYKDSLKYYNLDTGDVYAKNEDGSYKLTDKQVKQIIKTELNKISPLTPLGRLQISERNASGTITKGIFADANSIHAELCRKNIEYFIPSYLTRGVQIEQPDGTKSYFIPAYRKGVVGAYDMKYSLDQIHTPIDYIRQCVAASLDGAKDPVLYAAGINEFTAPILLTLLRLGLDFDRASMIISQPIVRKMNERYNVDKAVDPAGYYSILNYVDSFGASCAGCVLSDEALYNHDVLSKDYSDLDKDQQEAQQGLLGLLKLCGEINQEFFKIKTIIKRDTSSDKSFKDLYGIIASTANIKYYLKRNKEVLVNDNISENERTLFTPSISGLLDPDSENYIPRLGVVHNSVDQLCRSILNPFNPDLYNTTLHLCERWLDLTGGKMNGDVAKQMYEHYLAYKTINDSELKPFFKKIVSPENIKNLNWLLHFSQFNKALGERALQLQQKYSILSTNKFLTHLKLFSVKTYFGLNAIKKELGTAVGTDTKKANKDDQADSLTQYRYIGIESSKLTDNEIIECEDDFAKLSSLSTDGSDMAHEISEFINDLVATTMVRNSFSTVTENSILRFMQTTVKSNLFNGKYLKFFKERFSNNSGNLSQQNGDLEKFLLMFARHNPDYLRYEKFALPGKWYRKGSRKKQNMVIYKPDLSLGRSNKCFVYSRLGVPGLLAEYFKGTNDVSELYVNKEPFYKVRPKMSQDGTINVAPSNVGIDFSEEEFLVFSNNGVTIGAGSNNDLGKALSPEYEREFKYSSDIDEHVFKSVVAGYERLKDKNMTGIDKGLLTGILTAKLKADRTLLNAIFNAGEEAFLNKCKYQGRFFQDDSQPNLYIEALKEAYRNVAGRYSENIEINNNVLTAEIIEESSEINNNADEILKIDLSSENSEIKSFC